MMMGTGLAISIQKSWVQDMGSETARLAPQGALRALIGWSSPADSCDDPVPKGIARLISRALLKSGRLAFRLDGSPEKMSKGDQFFPERDAGSFAGFRRFLLRPEIGFGVLTTSNEMSASLLFEFGGWTEALQAVLVFSPEATDISGLLGPLQSCLDWRRKPLPSPAVALFGPGHDGSFGIIAAQHQGYLNDIINNLHLCATEAGIQVEQGPSIF